MTRTRTILSAAALLVLGALALTGCKAMEPYQDSPVGHRYQQPVEVYENADGFSNVSEFCDKHGNRIVVVFHGDSAYAGVTAIPNDPTCKG